MPDPTQPEITQEAAHTPSHTPGPWRQDADFPLIIVDATGGSLGEMTPGNPDVSDAQALANARLAVAAPDLLAALERMIEAAEIMASGYGRIDGKTPEDEDLYLYERGHDVILAEAADAARAAIARAQVPA